MTVRAVWNGAILAEAAEDEVELVEGNVYFPPEAVNQDVVADSTTHTRCWWKGEASYYDVVVDGQTNSDAAWYYPDPLRAAGHLKDRVAFWRGVQVERD